jgi:Signal transduction histidine kinase
LAIKSKNIDLKNTDSNEKENRPYSAFAGLISWLSMLALIYFIANAGFVLLLAVFDPQNVSAPDIYIQIFINGKKAPLYDLILQIVCLVCILIAFTVFFFLFRKDRYSFETKLVFILSKIWVEMKILLIPTALYFSTMFDRRIVMFAAIIFTYILCLDISHNRNLFKRNIIRSLLDTVNSSKNSPPFEQLSLKRLRSVIAIILGIIVLTVCLFSVLNVIYQTTSISDITTSVVGFSLAIFSLVGIIGTVTWYFISLKQDLKDFNEITDQVEKMYAGNLKAVNHIPPSSNFYDFAMQLNMIRSGIQKAVDEGIKADRTKVELITNVSHDIKTPLTSVITYIELLKKEEALPEHVRNYIEIISNKSIRLSHIVQDVFEVSKAATGNLQMTFETLDMSKLLQQILAEMDETLKNAPVTWRVDIPDSPAMISADGQKLYRVFQNLIRNCAQYSLEGSRVYIHLLCQNNFARVTIRNVSKAELSPTSSEYLTGRFVRGDQSRTTDGSGLGLSIAKSFTEACGGQFILQTEKDLFLTIVQFPLQAPPPVPETDTLLTDTLL